MYSPSQFEESRITELRQLVAAHPLATLVVAGGGGLVADHVPMLWRDDGSALGVLVGHVARANPLWQRAGNEVLAVFQGPQHYITPSWYATKREHGRVVPTWNYAVAHLHGELVAQDDQTWLRQLLRELTERHEQSRAEPWSIDDAPAEYFDPLLSAIVGIEIPVARIEGKFKLSQNQPAANIDGVVEGLDEAGDADAMEALMRRYNGRS